MYAVIVSRESGGQVRNKEYQEGDEEEGEEGAQEGADVAGYVE